MIPQPTIGQAEVDGDKAHLRNMDHLSPVTDPSIYTLANMRYNESLNDIRNVGMALI